MTHSLVTNIVMNYQVIIYVFLSVCCTGISTESNGKGSEGQRIELRSVPIFTAAVQRPIKGGNRSQASFS